MVFANHILNNDVLKKENWKWKTIIVNANLEKEITMLEAYGMAAKNFSKEIGIETLVQDIISSPPDAQVFSDTAFLAIIKDKCKIIFHGMIGSIKENDALNFCTKKSGHSLKVAIDTGEELKIIPIQYKMYQRGSIRTPSGQKEVRYIHFMLAFIYIENRYTLMFSTVEKVEMGIPKLTKNVKKTYILNDKIQRIKI